MFQFPTFLTGMEKTVLDAVADHAPNAGWGKRRLNRFKIENGVKYQLHATRGWKKVGREETTR